MNNASRPLIHSCPSLVTGPYRGGITTRVGFPAADTNPARDDQSREQTRRTLARAIGVDSSQMCWLKQVHEATVLVPSGTGYQGEADALVSTDPDRVLLVSVADCGPVLLWDPRARVHAAVHAGWRGALAGVVTATLDAMLRHGASTDTTQVWIGPSIGVGHFEVGTEVAERFDSAHVRPAQPPERPRPHVDLRAAIRAQLQSAGISERQIQISPHCTFAQPDLYWSYRRDQGICGRHVAFLSAPTPS